MQLAGELSTDGLRVSSINPNQLNLGESKRMSFARVNEMRRGRRRSLITIDVTFI